MPEAVIVSAVRTAVGRSGKGSFATTRPDELAANAVRGALERVPALETKEIGDLILGCAMPEGEQGWNFARTVVLRTGLPVEIGGVTVNRLCASGLDAIAQAAYRVQSGQVTAVVAGGAESMSMIPMGGIKPSPNPWLADFVRRYGKPYDPAEKYAREPMAVDVSEGKTDPTVLGSRRRASRSNQHTRPSKMREIAKRTRAHYQRRRDWTSTAPIMVWSKM